MNAHLEKAISRELDDLRRLLAPEAAMLDDLQTMRRIIAGDPVAIAEAVARPAVKASRKVKYLPESRRQPGACGIGCRKGCPGCRRRGAKILAELRQKSRANQVRKSAAPEGCCCCTPGQAAAGQCQPCRTRDICCAIEARNKRLAAQNGGRLPHGYARMITK